MTSTDFDAAAFKSQQREIWDMTSHAWYAWRHVYEQGAAVVSERLLASAGVREGQRVLDVATGHGEPALAAAERVGPAGRVVGLDISPTMLELARRRAAGRANVEFAQGDMEELDFPPGSFDVVLCRFALMLSTDHLATFRGLARVLAPGGVLSAAVWGPHESHLLAVGPTALSEHLGWPAPPPGVPTTFSMSDAAVLAAELESAGFTDVSVDEQVVPYTFASVQEYVRYNKEILPAPMLRMIADQCGSADDPEPWGVVAAAAERHLTADGAVFLPSVTLCLRAVSR